LPLAVIRLIRLCSDPLNTLYSWALRGVF